MKPSGTAPATCGLYISTARTSRVTPNASITREVNHRRPVQMRRRFFEVCGDLRSASLRQQCDTPKKQLPQGGRLGLRAKFRFSAGAEALLLLDENRFVVSFEDEIAGRHERV